MSMQIKMMLELPIKVVKKERWFIASCPALDVVDQGDTAEEAKAHLGEALMLFLESCLDRGVLEEVLRDCGFEPVCSDESDVAEREEIESPEDTIDVPLYLLAKLAGSGQCHHA